MSFKDKTMPLPAAFGIVLALAGAVLLASETRPRAREFGLIVGVLPTGPLNAITDVAGVAVGQVTLVEGRDVRTGVTAILPHGGNVFQDKVPAADLRRQRLRQAHRRDPGPGARHARDAHRPDQHAERPDGGRRRHRLDARPARQREGRIGQPGRRRDERRLAQRHPRPARHQGPRPRGHPHGLRRPGRRRRRRRGHGHDLLRLQGRDRHVLAPAARRRGADTRSASSSRRTSAAS